MQLRIEGQFVGAFPNWFGDDGQLVVSKRGIIIVEPNYEPHVWNTKRQRWDKINWVDNASAVKDMGAAR